MRLILFLLLASCAFGQTHPNPYIHERRLDSIDSLLSDLDKRLKALEDRQGAAGTIRIDTLSAPSWKTVPRDSAIIFDSLIANPKWELRIVPLGGDTGGNHGRFYPILSKVRSDSVVERKHGRFYCDLAGHSWAWGDTTDYCGPEKNDDHFWCPGICRVCKADTLALWSYAEDQQRKQSAKKLTEYEMLRERKRK